LDIRLFFCFSPVRLFIIPPRLSLAFKISSLFGKPVEEIFIDGV